MYGIVLLYYTYVLIYYTFFKKNGIFVYDPGTQDVIVKLSGHWTGYTYSKKHMVNYK